MPPKATGSNLSASEMKLFAAIIQFTTADPVCDWDAVADAAGYSNAANAKTMYRRFKKAIVQRSGGELDTPLATPATTPKSNKSAKSTPKKTKRRAATESDEERDSTPTPKSARLMRKKTKVQVYKEEPSGDEGGATGESEVEVETPVAAKKSGHSLVKSSGKTNSSAIGKDGSEDPDEEQIMEVPNHEVKMEQMLDDGSQAGSEAATQAEDDAA